MDLPRGDWTGGQSDATPASEYDLRYGENILKKESGSWPPYFIVTSPSAFESIQTTSDNGLILSGGDNIGDDEKRDNSEKKNS